MKVSLSWLKDYISIEMEPADLADALTMIGLEVESVADRYGYLRSVVVGRVEEISPHQNADKLKVCRVSTGDRQFSVVCGAPNVEVGMLAPLASPGTVFPDGSQLEKTVIRGDKLGRNAVQRCGAWPWHEQCRYHGSRLVVESR